MNTLFYTQISRVSWKRASTDMGDENRTGEVPTLVNCIFDLQKKTLIASVVSTDDYSFNILDPIIKFLLESVQSL